MRYTVAERVCAVCGCARWCTAVCVLDLFRHTAMDKDAFFVVLMQRIMATCPPREARLA